MGGRRRIRRPPSAIRVRRLSFRRRKEREEKSGLPSKYDEILFVVKYICGHFNLLKDGMFMRSVGTHENNWIVEIWSDYIKDHIKTKTQFHVKCYAKVVLKIKVMVRMNYILLFEEYYLWKSRKRWEVLMKISSLESFELEDHD